MSQSFWKESSRMISRVLIYLCYFAAFPTWIKRKINTVWKVLRTVSKTKQTKKVNTFFCLLILLKKKKSTYLGADDLLNKTPKWNRRDKIETVPFNHWKRFAVIIWGERSPLFFYFTVILIPQPLVFLLHVLRDAHLFFLPNIQNSNAVLNH